jgi:hypothetical protein
MAVLLARGSKMRTFPSLHTEAIYDPQGLHDTPKTFFKEIKKIKF